MTPIQHILHVALGLVPLALGLCAFVVVAWSNTTCVAVSAAIIGIAIIITGNRWYAQYDTKINK